jgi:hypothetical protein
MEKRRKSDLNIQTNTKEKNIKLKQIKSSFQIARRRAERNQIKISKQIQKIKISKQSHLAPGSDRNGSRESYSSCYLGEGVPALPVPGPPKCSRLGPD